MKELFDTTKRNLNHVSWIKVPHRLFKFILQAKIQAKILYWSPVNPFNKTWLEKVERAQTATIKKKYFLPPNTQTAILYLPTAQGGLGFPSITIRDDNTFMQHYLAALNSINTAVKYSTRDRLINTLRHTDPLDINPKLSDAHRFICTLVTMGTTLWHKPPQGKPPIISPLIWTSDLRPALARHKEQLLAAGLFAIHQIATPKQNIITRRDLNRYHNVFTTQAQYDDLAKATTTNGTSLTVQQKD